MKKKIIRKEFAPHYAEVFGKLHPVLSKLYALRSVSKPDDLEKTLEKLHPFQSLLGIESAVQLLAQALTNDDSILIVGDFDADGATSTAVAIRALRSFGAKHVSYRVPNRFDYGYGLTPELVRDIEALKPQLIVTVDNGIANHAGVEAAKALGIKVLITDHHLPAPSLPVADAIVNPNQPHDLFPSKVLAGVGVIFYIMIALRRHLINQNWFEEKKLAVPSLAALLDLVALGTVADLVPLDHNNRILVYQGLKRIQSQTCIPGIQALLELAGKNLTRVSSSDLSFIVAARLNAAGRLDDMSLGIECLLSDDLSQARVMAETLNKLNNERKGIEQTMQAQAFHALNQWNGHLEKELARGICLFDETWHQGVIGILAARVKDRFHRPTIIFAPGMEDELKGSARSIAALHIRDTLALIDVRYPRLIKKFGGHAMAAGLTIKNTHFNDFKKAFEATVAEQLTEEQLQHALLSDGELAPEYMNLDLALLLREAGPWGQAFPEPLFDDIFKVLDQRIVGGKHLKLKLAKHDKNFDAVAFFVDLEQWPNHYCERIRAAYRLDVNEYKGLQSLQLIVEYLEAASL